MFYVFFHTLFLGAQVVFLLFLWHVCEKAENSWADGLMIYAAYHNLWTVELAFRIAKSKLEVRPMFHFTRKRIEAHICICFVAWKVYKEIRQNTQTQRHQIKHRQSAENG